MTAHPVDLEMTPGDDEVLVVLSDGTREPLSEWMRRRFERLSESSLVERVGARVW